MIRQEFQGKYAQLQDELETVKQKAAQEASVVPSIPISQKEKLSQVKGGKVDDATKARVDDIEEAVLKVSWRYYQGIMDNYHAYQIKVMDKLWNLESYEA